MKRTPLSRKTSLKAKSKLAARCQCGHSKSKHRSDGCWDVQRGDGCICARYRPKRSLTQGKPMKARKASPEKRRFAKLRLPEYAAWIRAFVCALWSTNEGCVGDTEAAHVKSRGAGGADAGNIVALCCKHHREQHAIGIQSFQRKYGCDLKAIAETLWLCYQLENGL